jgi:hypothetical protein
MTASNNFPKMKPVRGWRGKWMYASSTLLEAVEEAWKLEHGKKPTSDEIMGFIYDAAFSRCVRIADEYA